MIWTEEAVSTLRTLMADGLSFRQTADELAARFGGPLSRSAVGGACYRFGIEAKVRERVVQTAKTRPSVRKMKRAKPVRSKVPLPPRPEREIVCEGLPASLGVSLVDNEGCRFITSGTGLGARYCGHPRVEGKAWCRGHMRVVYSPRGAADV